ncbi:MAG: hypothetical protein HQL07_16470 [Nitrospirae bacterium]|nr:hypothetical protein [Magnetococcales bacterium]
MKGPMRSGASDGVRRDLIVHAVQKKPLGHMFWMKGERIRVTRCLDWAVECAQ